MYRKYIAIATTEHIAVSRRTVVLKDHQHNAFYGQIIPFMSIPTDIIEAIPDDEYELDYKAALRAIKGFSGNARQEDHSAEAFDRLSSGSVVHYAIVGAQGTDISPDTIYGYAGFKRNEAFDCLELIHLYSRNYFIPAKKDQVFNFGRSFLGFGQILNDLLYSSDTERVMYVGRIRSEAKGFYKKMGFRRKWGFMPARILLRNDVYKLSGGSCDDQWSLPSEVNTYTPSFRRKP